MQAGRETASIQPPPRSSWLPTAAGVVLSVIGLFIVTGFRVFVFCLLHQRVAEGKERSKTGGQSPRWGTGSPASLSCPALSHCVALGHVTMSLPSLPRLLRAMGWFHPNEHSLLVYSSLSL